MSRLSIVLSGMSDFKVIVPLFFLLTIAACAGDEGALTITVIKDLKATTAGGLYTPNRAPLQPTAFLKLPIGAITPQGWLRSELKADSTGIVGRMQEISDYLQYDKTGWIHPENDGWEEVTYWIRGYGDLGYVLQDEKITADATKWVKGIMATQDKDGYFGPTRLKPDPAHSQLPDPWPHMPALDAIRSYYDFSHDESALKFMANYFHFIDTMPDAYFNDGWAALRWADNLDSVYWLYNRTGDKSLLDLAQKIHKNSASYMHAGPDGHNVNLAQGIREPGEYWQQATDPTLLDATEQDYERIMNAYGQFSGGGFAGDENTRAGHGDPRQGFETCGIVEFMKTFEIMSQISSNPVWADRNEEIAFNDFPAALSPDHKGTHYVTTANGVQLDNEKKTHQQFQNSFPLLAYMTGIHQYRCCPHNYGMGWPYYAENLWLATYDNGLYASLYAASEVQAKVGDGTEVKFTEDTDYPFSDTVTFKLSTPKAVSFPLYLRTPGWCESATLQINGKPVDVKTVPLSYLKIDRHWSDGDTVTWQMPMTVQVKTWDKNENSVSIDYGPLAFSLKIGEKWVKTGGTEDWPEMSVYATTPWNYGLVLSPLNPTHSITVNHKPGPLASDPFTLETNPLELTVQARRIPNWTTDNENVVTPLQPSPVHSDEPEETVTLVPMGVARLRITSFPVIGTSAGAHDWVPVSATPQVSASHPSDNLDALVSDSTPQSSSDKNVPRFTWWPQKGTEEWAQIETSQPRNVSAISVYWFDDTGAGECRVPASWQVLYKDGDDWKPVETSSPGGVAANQLNRVAFTPVTTTGLRIVVKLRNNFSGGILGTKVE
jgi:hypothetical protein